MFSYLSILTYYINNYNIIMTERVQYLISVYQAIPTLNLILYISIWFQGNFQVNRMARVKKFLVSPISTNV